MQENEKNIPIIGEIRKKISSKNRQELVINCLYQPNKDVAGTLTARLILEEAKKLGLSGKAIDVDVADMAGHVFVVLDDMEDDDYPLNGSLNMSLKVSEIISKGNDVTREILDNPYSKIM